MPFNDALGGGETKPCAAMLRRKKWLEDSLAHVVWNPRAVVGDGDAAQTVVGGHGDADLSLIVCCLRRVQQEIDEDELQLFDIGPNDDMRVGDIDVRCRMRRIPFEKGDGAPKQIFEYDRCELRLTRPRKYEQVVDDIVQRVQTIDDVAHDSPITAVSRHAPADHLKAAADSSQRILDLVGHDGRHFTETCKCSLFTKECL